MKLKNNEMDVDLIMLGESYAMIKFNADFVVCWLPIISKGEITWASGVYFKEKKDAIKAFQVKEFKIKED